MKVLLVPLLLIAAVAVSGCAVTNTPTEVPEFAKTEVLLYSNPIMDSVMLAMNSGNYGLFSANFSQAMKDKINSEAFDRLISTLRTSVGKYASRDSAAEVIEISGYYRVTYTTQFTDDNPVYVIMSFKKGDSSHLIEGLFFSSKKLSGTI